MGGVQRGKETARGGLAHLLARLLPTVQLKSDSLRLTGVMFVFFDCKQNDRQWQAGTDTDK